MPHMHGPVNWEVYTQMWRLFFLGSLIQEFFHFPATVILQTSVFKFNKIAGFITGFNLPT